MATTTHSMKAQLKTMTVTTSMTTVTATAQA
jgi:hypothetical protein